MNREELETRRYLHTRMRAWARYELELTRNDYDKLVALLRSGRVPVEFKCQKTKHPVYRVTVRGKKILAVFRPKEKLVVTVLPGGKNGNASEQGRKRNASHGHAGSGEIPARQRSTVRDQCKGSASAGDGAVGDDGGRRNLQLDWSI